MKVDERFFEDGDYLTFQASCTICKHKNPGVSTCTAFPQKIPLLILNGKIDHRKPVRGDNGIQFEPLDEPDIASSSGNG